MNYKPHHSLKRYLAKVQSHKKPYTTTVLGKKIIVCPNVMSPKYDKSSEFHIENMPNQRRNTFLEIGSGSGVISLFAKMQGANVTAVDINPHAVNNTKVNFQKYGLEARVKESNLFNAIKPSERFDTITFAAPYHGYKPKTWLERGVTDYNYDTLRKFLKQAREYLRCDGEIHLGFSNTGDEYLLKDEIIKNRYKIKAVHSKHIDDWEAKLYILKPMNYLGEEKKYIYDDDYFWFKEYKEFVKNGSVLKVGHGNGYATSFIKMYNPKTISIDVIANGADMIYEGSELPFDNKGFDTIVCCYTLHHSENPEKLFSEIVRTSKRRIIVLEETYNNKLQKLNLVYNCFMTNLLAGQKVDIHWDNYMSREMLKDMIKRHNLKIIKQHTEKKESYYKELFVLEK